MEGSFKGEAYVIRKEICNQLIKMQMPFSSKKQIFPTEKTEWFKVYLPENTKPN